MAENINRISITLPNGATAAVGSQATTPLRSGKGNCKGVLIMVKVVTPSFTNNVTTLVKLYDANGIMLWQSAALARGSGAPGYPSPVFIGLTYGEYFTATPSGDPGAGGGIVTIDCDYIRD